MYVIKFSNGYGGCCDEEKVFEGTYNEALTYAKENLYDYAKSYAYVAFDWKEEYTNEEWQEYFENCSYTIREAEEEE